MVDDQFSIGSLIGSHDFMDFLGNFMVFQCISCSHVGVSSSFWTHPHERYNWPVEECLEHPWLVERCERRRIRRLRAEGRTSLGGASLLLGIDDLLCIFSVVLRLFSCFWLEVSYAGMERALRLLNCGSRSAEHQASSNIDQYRTYPYIASIISICRHSIQSK